MEIIDKLSQEAISSIEELEEGRLVEVVEGIDAGLNTAKQISELYNDDGCDGIRGIWEYVDHNGGGEYVSAVALVDWDWFEVYGTKKEAVERVKEVVGILTEKTGAKWEFVYVSAGPRHKELVAIFCKH